MNRQRRIWPVFVGVVFASAVPADEGMWLFNDLPLERLRAKHDFAPAPSWTEHLMRSAVRVGSGGSGSFISPDGLILTNHHVGADALLKLSTPAKDLIADGYVAHSRSEELKCPDLEVVSLVEILDVTGRVQGAAPPGADTAAALKARQEEIGKIEKESKDATKLESEVVTLYNGGAYHLYRYRRFEDVRLVMAPETAIAFFGGDRDNFEFPRYDLDICLFRAYEGGKPARVDHYLSLAAAPVKENELVLIAGHPGSTQRLYTVAHTEFVRDVELPFRLTDLAWREVTLEQFSIRGEEEARIARDDLFGVQNSRKARRGILAGLLEPELFTQKMKAEAALQAQVAARPDLGASIEDWNRIAAAMRAFRPFYGEYQLLESSRGFWSELYAIARMIVRLTEEKKKPSAERLPWYYDSDMDSLMLKLMSTAPIYPQLERATLAHSLGALAMWFGADHPLVEAVLQGRSPAARAAEVVDRTRLAEIPARKELVDGGAAAVAASTDPMIALARAVDPYARAVRKRYEDLVQSVERDAYGRIAKARFALEGTSVYPDATFTLRLAFGVVTGVTEDGATFPFATTLKGAFDLYDRHQGREPYELPQTWLRARDALDLSTPFNFISTADIIGGNSGSPVVNRDGELVGLIFDGNLGSLIWDIFYTEERGRSISVSAAAIMGALEKIYGADAIVKEIRRR